MTALKRSSLNSITIPTAMKISRLMDMPSTLPRHPIERHTIKNIESVISVNVFDTWATVKGNGCCLKMNNLKGIEYITVHMPMMGSRTGQFAGMLNFSKTGCPTVNIAHSIIKKTMTFMKTALDVNMAKS